MYNRKMNKLMIGQAILFALIIIFFGFIVVREKVPRLKEKSVEEDINSYYEENYTYTIINPYEHYTGKCMGNAFIF